MRYLEEEQRQQIGFTYVMDRVEVLTPYGTEEKKKIKPFGRNRRDELIEELDNLDTIVEGLKKHRGQYGEIERVFFKLKDIRTSIKRCREEELLDEVELYEIKYFTLMLEELIEAYSELHMKLNNIKFKSLACALRLLDPEGQKLPTFYIYDGYSVKLQEIRKEKNRLEKLIYKEKDASKVEKLKELRLDVVILEEEEEQNIRRELTHKLAPLTELFEENIKSIGRLDFLMAKAKLSVAYEGVRPEISMDMHYLLEEGVNPEVYDILSKRGRNFTPISIELRGGTTVITGANMGGKSVTLKTIVLNALLAQMGFYVFAKSACIPLMDFIHYVSDDMQNISQGLSTFGAEIIKLKEVLLSIKNGCGFVALDEFARGTNPKEGLYLAKSLCSYLINYSSISLMSTHYDGVVSKDMVHYQVIGLKNINFDKLKYRIDLNKTHSVELIQENMDYRLERVGDCSDTPKDALNIAQLLGLDEELISLAKSYYEEPCCYNTEESQLKEEKYGKQIES